MFRGRIGVADYWKSVLLLILIAVVVGAGGAIIVGIAGLYLLGATLPSTPGDVIAGLFGVLAFAAIPYITAVLFACVTGIGLQIRRLHDLGLSGWIILVFWGLSAVVALLGRTGITDNILQFYQPWAWALLAVGSIAWLVIAFWPGKLESNAYGAPIVYLSWWTAAIGRKTEGGYSDKTIWTFLLVVVGGATVAIIAFLLFKPTASTPQIPALSTAGEDAIEAVQTTTTTVSTNTNTQNKPTVAPKLKQAQQPVGTVSNINGIGAIPAGTFTNNTFLEDNTYVTPKGTQTLRPPMGWKGGVLLDAWLKSSTKPNGLTSVQFADPSKSDGSAVLMVLIADKEANFSLTADEAKQSAKATVISRSDVSFYGMPGYMLEQTAVEKGINLHLKSVTISSPTKVYVMVGASKEGDWSSYDSLYTASFATLQAR